jgi:hypothetical protein
MSQTLVDLSSLEQLAGKRRRFFCFALVIALSAWVFAGCVYRFTNLHLSPPQGIQTIAVEAVYDSSREVVPHDVIWEKFQRALAADGNLQVVHRSKADAILVAHVLSSSLIPTGSVIEADPSLKDPPVSGTISPPAPQEIRRLPEAGRFMDRSALGLVIRVEVHNLATGAKLFDRTYSQSSTIISVRPSTSREGNFLREDEAQRAKIDAMTTAIATNAVQDLLVR